MRGVRQTGGWRLKKQSEREGHAVRERKRRKKLEVRRSEVHLFSFPPPQSEESPTGGLGSLICYP